VDTNIEPKLLASKLQYIRKSVKNAHNFRITGLNNTHTELSTIRCRH